MIRIVVGIWIVALWVHMFPGDPFEAWYKLPILLTTLVLWLWIGEVVAELLNKQHEKE